MIKKILNLIILNILIFLVINILISSSDIMFIVKNGISLWSENIVPSLLPFFILSEFLIAFDFVRITSYIFKPVMKYIFKINSNTSFIFIMSLISGSPSNAKYTKSLLDRKLISIDEANKIILFTHFCNPLFILGGIGVSLLHNYYIGLLILISHYIPNIILGILLRNKVNKDYSYENCLIDNNSKNFSKLLSNSIINSFNTLILILGSIITFLILSYIISKYLLIDKVIINSILEITGGIKVVSLENINIKYLGAIISSILSFGGISIHSQVFSILPEVKYYPYLLCRIIHSILSFLIFLLLYNLFI